jgi:hypothetical protein
MTKHVAIEGFNTSIPSVLSRHGRRQHGIGAVPGRRPIIGPMTPGIELAQRIEQAQILVIVNAPDIFTAARSRRSHRQLASTGFAAWIDTISSVKRPALGIECTVHSFGTLEALRSLLALLLPVLLLRLR